MLPQIGEQQKTTGYTESCAVPPNPRSVSHANRSPGLASSYWDAFPPFGSGILSVRQRYGYWDSAGFAPASLRAWFAWVPHGTEACVYSVVDIVRCAERRRKAMCGGGRGGRPPLSRRGIRQRIEPASRGSGRNEYAAQRKEKTASVHTGVYTCSNAEQQPGDGRSRQVFSAYLTKPFRDGITVTDSQGFSPYSACGCPHEQACTHIYFSCRKHSTARLVLQDLF